MNSIYSNKIPVATAMAFALGAGAVQPVLAQTSQAGKEQASSAIQAGPVTLQFGGFAEETAIYRNRNEVSDVASDFGGLPLSSNTGPYRQSEFRESARQSRFSLLAQGAPYNHVRAEAYLESDFLSAGVTSNSRESNSYTLRMRHFYGRLTYDNGFEFLGGQTWSLATLTNKAAMGPRDAVTPLGIEAQYVVGFNWTRTPQLRFTQNFSKEFAVAVSVESPQAITGGGSNLTAGAPPASGNPTPSTTPLTTAPAASCGPITNFFNCGDSAGLNNSITTYSTDSRPDVIVKAALDPGYGHYEIYGLARFFTSYPTVNGVSHSNTKTGGGVGAGAILPLVPDILNFQISGLAGRGIGRYASGQLADVTQRMDGTLSPIKAYQFLSGLTLTPNPLLTVYAYYGREMTENNFQTFTNLTSTTGTTIPTAYYGFGSPFGSTQKLYEITVGQWYKFYQGVLGNAQVGLQGEYVQKDAFKGITGTPGNSGNIFIGMVSFRYYPYQR